MQVEIRREKAQDIEEVNLLFKLVFEKEPLPQMLTDFRKSSHFIPELARVATINNQIIGVVMYSKAEISKGRRSLPAIVLSVIAVLPSYQGLGIGSELLRKSFQEAREQEYKSIFVLGQEDVFRQFGFISASQFEIQFPLEGTNDDFLVLELQKDGLIKSSGNLKTHPLVGAVYLQSI